MFRQFFRAMPDELIQAARMDGLGEWSIVWRIVVPNAWPAATAFAIFSVVAHWNDLFWPLIAVSGKGELATPALGVIYFRTEEAGDDFGALMAAATLTHHPARRCLPPRPAPLHRGHHHDRAQGMSRAGDA